MTEHGPFHKDHRGRIEWPYQDWREFDIKKGDRVSFEIEGELFTEIVKEVVEEEIFMTPAEAARSLADDYDLIGTQDADWMATAWRRYAAKFDSSIEEVRIVTE